MIETQFPVATLHYSVCGLVIGAVIGLLDLLTGPVGGMSTVIGTEWCCLSHAPGFQMPNLLDSRRWRLVYGAGLVPGGLIHISIWAAPVR